MPITAEPQFRAGELAMMPFRMSRQAGMSRMGASLALMYASGVTPITHPPMPSYDPIIRAVIDSKRVRTTLLIQYVSNAPPLSCWERLRTNYTLFE